MLIDPNVESDQSDPATDRINQNSQQKQFLQISKIIQKKIISVRKDISALGTLSLIIKFLGQQTRE